MSAPTDTPISLDMSKMEPPCGGGGCDERDAPSETMPNNGLAKMLLSGLFNAVDLCFDEVLKEPKRILMIGGCRQRDFAQHIALLIPSAEIVLLDPDPAEAVKAKEEVCCRFDFVTGPVESMPFENDRFDLVFAHNLLQFTSPDAWERAIKELGRITDPEGNVMASVHRPMVYGLAKHWPGFDDALAQTGVQMPDFAPSAVRFYGALAKEARVKARFNPMPWTVWMTAMAGEAAIKRDVLADQDQTKTPTMAAV